MNLPTNLISEELKIFESRFREAMRGNVPLLNRILRYIVKRKGKQLRPMFVLLSARLGGEINDPAYRAASLVELLHTATLVHDDVVDDSMERRGFFSTFALWKAKANILIGDYLLAKGLLLSLDNNDYRILHILSDAVRKMSEGELLQMQNLLVGMRTGDDQQIRIDRARLLDNLPPFKGIGDRHQKAARCSQVGAGQHLGIGCIAGDGFRALLARAEGSASGCGAAGSKPAIASGRMRVKSCER